ncbi:MAG: tetratricopeptide repeat protein [Methylococcaceae bacterium]
MSGIIPKYEYDIFISYRQKDNKYDGWVTEFVQNLRRELGATFKEDIKIYFDENPADGLLEIYNVDKSLEAKLKCLIFIPVISRTYCDPKSFAWRNEFVAFNKLAKDDSIGRDLKLSNGNVISRILPVKIHEIGAEDKALINSEINGELRSIEFIYREPGVNRPLKPSDNRYDNLNKTDYRNQINKTANAIEEIIGSLKMGRFSNPDHNAVKMKRLKGKKVFLKNPRSKSGIFVVFVSIIILAGLVLLLKGFFLSPQNSNTNNNITLNTKAYEWYKKAEFRLTPENQADVDSCIFFLTKAIDADPLFALAHAKLSRAYSYKNYFIDPDGGYSEKAYVEAEKSLYLNHNLAEGYFAKAYCNWTFKNKFPHEKTIRDYKKAILLNKKFSDAHLYLGIIYFHVGLIQESFDEIRKALEIDPDNKFARLNIIDCYFYTGKKAGYEKVVELYKQQPEHLISPMRASFWAYSLIALDRTIEAENILSANLEKDSSKILINSVMAILLAKNGDKKGALKKIEFCEGLNLNTGHSHHAVYNIAVAYALLGYNEESVEKLTWVAENGFPNYILFRDDQMLASLHQFAPYLDLLQKLKMQWENFRKIAKE